MSGGGGVERTAGHLKAIVDAFTQLAQTTHQLQDNGDSRKLLQFQMYPIAVVILLICRNGILGLLGSIPEVDATEEVPVDLIRSLDFGKHPDAWLREQMDGMARAQKDCQAKAQGLETFHSMLTQQLADILPPSPADRAASSAVVAEDEIIVD
jgi:hypothetical protein